MRFEIYDERNRLACAKDDVNVAKAWAMKYLACSIRGRMLVNHTWSMKVVDTKTDKAEFVTIRGDIALQFRDMDEISYNVILNAYDKIIEQD